MIKINVFTNDFSFLNLLQSSIDKNKYQVLSVDVEPSKAFSYCLSSGAEVILIHSSYVKNYSLFHQLLNTNRFIVLYLSSKNELGSLYSILNNPRFYLINDLKYYCINEILELMLRDIKLISALELEKEKYIEKIEEEKWIRKAKLYLMQQGASEEEAYKRILKKSMNERITKKLAAKKILEEEGF